MFNLVRNSQLRQDVQTGVVSSAELVDRALNNSRSLATPAQQATYEAARVAYAAHRMPRRPPVRVYNTAFDTDRWEYIQLEEP